MDEAYINISLIGLYKVQVPTTLFYKALSNSAARVSPNGLHRSIMCLCSTSVHSF